MAGADRRLLFDPAGEESLNAWAENVEMTSSSTEEHSAPTRLFEISYISETGPVRDENQDSVRIPSVEQISSPGFLCALADGMGGYEHGSLAGKLATEAMFECFYAPDGAARSTQRAMEEGMNSANLRVLQAAQRLGAVRMGTTLTAAGIRGRRLWVAHAGDSRAYLVRSGRLRCLTEDHTVVGDLVRMKVVPAEKVRTHAQRSILTRAVGLGMFLQPDLISMGLQEGDRLVLCSDGLWSAVEDVEIGSITTHAANPEEVNRKLVDLALQRDTDDNVSVVSVFIHSLENEQLDDPNSKGWLERVRGLFLKGRNGTAPR
jgi:PPM family protein phosphatase